MNTYQSASFEPTQAALRKRVVTTQLKLWQAKYHRLAALMMMSGAGVVTCLTFLLFSAPDLGLTQLTVEVVTTVLFLLGLRWLPRRIEDMPGRVFRVRCQHGTRHAERGDVPDCA